MRMMISRFCSYRGQKVQLLNYMILTKKQQNYCQYCGNHNLAFCSGGQLTSGKEPNLREMIEALFCTCSCHPLVANAWEMFGDAISEASADGVKDNVEVKRSQPI